MAETDQPVRAAAAPDEVTALAETTVADRPREGVQSLARAFSILQEIARHPDGIGLADLSKRVGLHSSTAFHLVKTMVGLGYVRQSPETRRYSIGRMIFTLAAGALDEVALVSQATPVLEALARSTGESCHLAVRAGDDIVVVARTAGTGAFQLTDRVGVMRPAHATALGKVLLAGLSDRQVERFLADRPLEAFTPNTITDPTRLATELARVRAEGVAFDDGEFNPEVRCVAVPVQDFTGQVAGSVGVSGPVWRLTIQRLQETTTAVKDAARQIGQALGHRDPAG